MKNNYQNSLYRLLSFIFSLIFLSIFTLFGQIVDIKITTFNVEWLSCVNNGPTDEEQQENNIVSIIQTINPDIIALQEVGTSSTYATIDTLVKKLGVNQWGGAIVPSSPNNCGQNQGIIYKKATVEAVNANLMNSGNSSQGNSYSFNWSNGRFPVMHELNLKIGSDIVPITLINIHAKAMGDNDSYTRRLGASIGLKTILDGTNYNQKNVIVIGDFNDYLIGTQNSSNTDSPYKNLIDDSNNYQGLTTNLTDPYYNSPVIDNIIISNELFNNYITGSAIIETVATNAISNYRQTTSDHTPISVTLRFIGSQPPCDVISFSETFGTSLGPFSPYSVTGTQVWHWRNIYGAYMSGFANSNNNPNEDWLISPAFDLTGKNSAILSFEHALNYAQEANERANNHTLWISTNYTEGDPKNASWTQLSIPTMPLGNNWTYVNSGSINLPSQWMKENVRFAFKYIATSSMAGTWEIKNLLFNATCEPTSILNTTDFEEKIYSHNKSIIILLEEEKSIKIYNVVGKLIYQETKYSDTIIPVNQSGIYLVNINNKCYKIVVK